MYADMLRARDSPICARENMLLNKQWGVKKNMFAARACEAEVFTELVGADLPVALFLSLRHLQLL